MSEIAVIATHSSCRALSDIPRNMSDEMLHAIAKNGGVVGVNFGSAFLNQRDRNELNKVISHANTVEPNLSGPELDRFEAAERREGEEDHPVVGQVTIENAVDCIEHIVKVAGIDHVGIGSDYDGVSSVPKGLEDVSKMPAATAALLKRGYTREDIKKIMGVGY
jgi:membrane dipeptidase